MITRKQLCLAAVNAIVVRVLVTFPSAIFEYCGNAAWISCLTAVFVALALFGVIRRVYVSNENVIMTAEKLGGVGARIAVGLAVFVCLACNIMGLVRAFPEIIRLVLLQKTYTEVIMVVFFGILLFGASCGIQANMRVIEIFIPVAAVVFAAFILMLIPNLNIEYIFPILGNGAGEVFGKGMSVLSIFTDLLALNVLLPYTRELDNYRKSGTKAIIIGGICAFLIFLAYSLCFAYPTSARFIVPVYQLERLINFGDFFSRLEAVFQFIWSIAILLHCTLYGAILSEIWKETFNLRHSRPIIAPILLLLIGISIIPRSFNDLILLVRSINLWLFIPSFAIPIIIGVWHKIKLFHVKQSEDI